jgi:AcrR family transcriptional regulator
MSRPSRPPKAGFVAPPPEYWLEFGDDPDPKVREKLLYLAIDEIARVGPNDFNSYSICDRINVTYPMVNHYFGGRNGLVAEAALVVYRRYIARLHAGVRAAPTNPDDRFRAWVWGQIRWTVDMRGWGAVLNYPDSCQESSRILRETHGSEMRELFEYNMAVLIRLIADVRSGSAAPWPEDFTPEFRAFAARDPEMMALGASIAWSTLGISVWSSGQHVPSSSVAEIDVRRDGLMTAHVERLLASVR